MVNAGDDFPEGELEFQWTDADGMRVRRIGTEDWQSADLPISVGVTDDSGRT